MKLFARLLLVLAFALPLQSGAAEQLPAYDSGIASIEGTQVAKGEKKKKKKKKKSKKKSSTEAPPSQNP